MATPPHRNPYQQSNGRGLQPSDGQDASRFSHDTDGMPERPFAPRNPAHQPALGSPSPFAPPLPPMSPNYEESFRSSPAFDPSHPQTDRFGGYNTSAADQGGVRYEQDLRDTDGSSQGYAPSNLASVQGAGLRHRTGESVSFAKPNAQFMNGSGPRVMGDDESMYSQYNKGWDDHASNMGAPSYYGDHPMASSSTTHLNQNQYNGNGWDAPGGYGGGHEAIEMQAGAPGFPPSTYHNGGAPAFPSPGGYGFGAQRMPEEHNIGAGWVGLAAPGTVLAQAQPRHTHAGYNETHERIMRRRTVKKLALENGNLVIETPVAPNICKQNQSKEFTHMRYTAATCDPDQFLAQRYALRPWLLGREIELCIVLTSYNEDEQLLVRTLNSVIKNIAYLTSRTKSKTWGLQGWTKVVVILVADGRKKADKRFLKLLQLMGVYQEGVMVDHVNDKPTVAHIFELTSQVMVSANGSVEVSQCPIQIMLCLKETNAKKLNSHRWFFNAFCAQLKPNVCILLDVGTKPAARSLYHLWKAFDNHPKCGGACGEITVETGRGCWQLVNPLVAAQNFEYKMSNILDKPLESVFGYITVLPGAFSAYRYKALQGRPLEAYFKGEALHSGTVHGGSFLGNMYLAEDRILCFELVAKRGEGWLLKYVKSARASTDVPDKLPAFIGQRRRWLNGSLFAAIYSTWHFGRMWTSGQSFLRKLLLQFQVIYSLVQLVFAFTGIANFYLAIYFLFSSATSDPKHDPFGGQGDSVLQIVLNALIAIVVVCLILSLGNRPQGSNLAYHAIVILLALLMGVALYTAGFTIYIAADAAGLTHLSGWTGDNILDLIKLDSFRDIVISLASTYVLWVVASVIHYDPWHLLTSFLQYLFLTPCFVIVLAIYSMANTHDLSWGNRPAEPAKDLGKASTTGGKDGKPAQVEVKTTTASDAAELWQSAQREMAVPRVEEKEHRAPTQKAADEAATFRTNLLLIYILVNAVLVLFFTSSYWKRFVRRERPGSSDPYMAALFWSTAGLSALRATGSVLYMIFRVFGH